MPVLPTTNLTLHCDASDNATLFTTANGGGSGVHTGTPGDGSAVAVWDDEGDGVTNVALRANAGTGPAWRSSVPLMYRPCLDCDRTVPQYFYSTTQNIGSTVAMSSFITNNAFTVVAAFWAESITTNAAAIYDNEAVLADGGGYWGLHLRNVSGVYRLYGTIYDGASRSVPSTGEVVTLATSYVVMFRMQSGSIYLSLNGGAEATTTAFPIVSIADPLRVGLSYVNAGLDGRVGEFAIYNAALTGANLTDAIQYFTDKWLPPTGGSLEPRLDRRMPRGLSRGLARGVA